MINNLDYELAEVDVEPWRKRKTLKNVTAYKIQDCRQDTSSKLFCTLGKKLRTIKYMRNWGQ
jgi:hypothetical protein